MTREEAIRAIGWLKCTTNREDDLEAIDMAIEALSAEPIKVITDDTIEVRYTDFENIKRIILTNGDIFCKMFYEDARQNDDSDYDSLVPDEYKTEPSDLISRADAIEAIEARIKWFNGDAIEDRCKRDAFIQASDIITELPSADRPSGEWEYDVDADDSFCTNCHKYAIRDMEMQLESDFCPNCGARMGVEE